MTHISSSPLDNLNLKDLSRLTLDRNRFNSQQGRITDIDITEYRANSNVINYLRAHQVPMPEAKEFHSNSIDFSEKANQLMGKLEGFGLGKQDFKSAWSKIETISDNLRDLTSLSTKGQTIRDFGRKFIDLGKLLTQLVFKDIILDQNIDKLKTYFNPA